MNDRVGPQLADEGVASKGEVGGVDGQTLTIHTLAASVEQGA